MTARDDYPELTRRARLMATGMHKVPAAGWQKQSAAALDEIDRLRSEVDRLAFDLNEATTAIGAYVQEDTYTVTWARDDGAMLTCRGLDLRTAAARLKGAIRSSGPVTVHSLRREAS